MTDCENGMAYNGWFDEYMARPTPEELGYDEDQERAFRADMDAMRGDWL